MGKGSSSSSSITSNKKSSSRSMSSSTSSSSSPSRRLLLGHRAGGPLTTDLNLGLGISSADHPHEDDDNNPFSPRQHHRGSGSMEEGDECDNATFYVKVYMEGIPIGRKLDLLAHDDYPDLITTLDYMFGVNILWSEMEGAQCGGCHVLLYEDKEGDWLMVGDVPWEMFLSSVKRLKITRVE